MNVLLFTGGDSNGALMLSLFDLIIAFVGIYSMYTARQMKKTGTPPEWLVAKRDLKRIKRPKEFCEEMAPRTTAFGLLCVIAGIYGVAASLLIGTYLARVAGVAVFIVVLIWFMVNLQNTRDKYMK